MRTRREMSDAEFAAIAKRARRAEAASNRPFLPVVPSNRLGPKFARAEKRRDHRRLKKVGKADRSSSATAARHRYSRGLTS